MSANEAEAKKKAWHELSSAATSHGAQGTAVTAQRLAEAACEWARAKGWREPREAAPKADAVLPNFGRQKGEPIAGVETKDLEWYASAMRRSIDDPEKARWADANQAVLDAIEAELERR